MAPGMTYAEVVELLGREGTLDSRTDGSDDPVVASYYWWNANGSYMEAAFENDRLVYKQQSRLAVAGARPRPAADNGGKAAPPPAVTGADLQTVLAKGMAICGTVVIAAIVLLPGAAPEPTDVDLFLPAAILVFSLMSLPRGTPSADAQWVVNVGCYGIIFIVCDGGGFRSLSRRGGICMVSHLSVLVFEHGRRGVARRGKVGSQVFFCRRVLLRVGYCSSSEPVPARGTDAAPQVPRRG